MSTSGRSAASQTPSPSEHRPISCITCKKRKVKCDKRSPCSNCTRKNIDCVYVNEKPRYRGPGKHPTSEKISAMSSRIAQLEQLVDQLSNGMDHPHLNTPQSSRDEDVSRLKEPQLAIAKGGEQKDGISELSADTSVYTSTTHNILFTTLHSHGDLALLRPPRLQIRQYWVLFLDRVDPIYRILHKPHIESLIQDASHQGASLSPGYEALLFSIYFAVVVSMPNGDLESIFYESKDCLLNRYRHALEMALAKANLLGTQELCTLQAFIFYIICIRRWEAAHRVWTLVGLAIRLATGMGLQHDGQRLHLSPWVTEMHRRLWWQLCIIDARAAEEQDHQVAIREDSFDTRMPLNIDDADLSIDATEYPVSREGFTEMTGCLMRFEFLRVDCIVRGLYPNTSEATSTEKLEAIRALEDVMQQNYLQHLHPDIPIAVFFRIFARLWIAKLYLGGYNPYHPSLAGEPSATSISGELSRDALLSMSISIIEGNRFVEIEPSLSKWAWVAQLTFQWHAITYVLMELSCTGRPPSSIICRAWRAIDSVLPELTGVLNDKVNTVVSRPIERLLARAQKRRMEIFPGINTDGNDSLPKPPVPFAELSALDAPQFQNTSSSNEPSGWSSGAFDWVPPCQIEPFQAPTSMPLREDIEFWDDMNGLLQGQPLFEDGGASLDREFVDWW